MTLGELKINSYKLIDPSDEEVTVDNIKEIYEVDTTYSFYFLNMQNSINLAITRIVQACILPIKRIEIDCSEEYQKTVLTDEDGEAYQSKKKANINLNDYVDDIYKIKLIEWEDTNGNPSKLAYRTIGSFLEIAQKSKGKFVIYYYPKIKSLEYYSAKQQLMDINELELEEIGLDDNLVSIIPYQVKADLLEHDKPTEAVLSRNTFEQYLASFETQEVEVKEPQKSWWGGLL